MNVTIISYTQNAEELLIYTKDTRRALGGGSMSNIHKMSEEERSKALDYVFSTISSPLEFVDYVFTIDGVTRAFTHQFVRHRVGTSFAQQAQRMPTVVRSFPYLATGSATNSPLYHRTMEVIDSAYQDLLEDGVNAQDARGVLPTNILTSITAKVNLRALNTIMNVRLCVRSQGEFQRVALEMRKAVLKIHPFVERSLLPFCLEWGSCKFPKFIGCPIKEDHPWLVPNTSMILEAKKTWECCVGEYDPQPK